MGENMVVHFKRPGEKILCGRRSFISPRPNFTYRVKAVNCSRCLELIISGKVKAEIKVIK